MVLLLCHCHCCCRDKYYDSSLRTIFISLCILMSYFTKVDDTMDGLSDPVQLQGNTYYIVGCKYSDWLNSHPPRDLLKFMRCKFLLKYYKTQSNLHKSFRSLGTGIYTTRATTTWISFFLSFSHSPYLSPCTNC